MSLTIQQDKRIPQLIDKTYGNCENISVSESKFYIPLIKLKSKLFGDKKISLPFMDIGGIFGKISDKKFLEIIKKIGNVEIKLNKSQENFNLNKKRLTKAGFKSENAKAQFYIKIENPEVKWKKFHKHTRNDIRKAEKSGLTLVKIDSPNELKKFYRLYFKEMKNFGTPCHSKNFFLNMEEMLGNDFFSLNCYKDGKLIASIVSLFAKGQSYLWFNVSDKRYKQYRANDLLYWKLIEESFKRKVLTIDVGQVDPSSEEGHARGLLKFKQKWLGKVVEKEYFSLSNGKKGINKKEKLKKFRKIWRKIPSSIVRIFGPKIASQLGV